MKSLVKIVVRAKGHCLRKPVIQEFYSGALATLRYSGDLHGK